MHLCSFVCIANCCKYSTIDHLTTQGVAASEVHELRKQHAREVHDLRARYFLHQQRLTVMPRNKKRSFLLENKSK